MSKPNSIRTCIACGTSAGKGDLLRVVRTPHGTVEFDPTGKMPGRGAYICNTNECIERACAKNLFRGRLRSAVSSEALNRLREDFDAL